MEKNEIIKEFENKLKYLKLSLEQNQIEMFLDYMNEIIKWNEKINLTAIIEPKEIIQKHFIDSLTVLPNIKKGSKIIDVGTGAGLPGIPLKIAQPDFKITLLDSLNKRLNFLNEIIKKLNLDNIETIHSRAEELGINKQYRETYDVSISRAVAPMNILAEYLIPFIKIGGICICMKGNNANGEIQDSKKAIEVLGGKIEKIIELKLPETDINRNIIIIKKVKNTPNTYPRKPGLPSKQPII